MSGLEYGFASHQQACACNILLQVLFNGCQEPLLASNRENLHPKLPEVFGDADHSGCFSWEAPET